MFRCFCIPILSFFFGELLSIPLSPHGMRKKVKSFNKKNRKIEKPKGDLRSEGRGARG